MSKGNAKESLKILAETAKLHLKTFQSTLANFPPYNRLLAEL